MEKYYLADTGLKTALMGYQPKDISGILENIVFIELLRRGYQVYIGKTDSWEIDFVAVKNDQRLYIQVCYLLASEDVIGRKYRSLEKIPDNHPKLVLSMDELTLSNRNGIEWQNIRDFLEKLYIV